jgi:ATP adenylyltransferase
MEYIQNKEDKEGECVFCLKSKQKNDRDNLVLYRGPTSFILMNLYPYNHIETTKSLSNESMKEIMMLADKSMDIFRDVMDAQGFNFGANIGISAGAGIADHIHFHVVPRWVGDTNFMPVLGHTKVMVDELTNTYDKLKIEFNKLK